jgi:hypothetical protein
LLVHTRTTTSYSNRGGKLSGKAKLGIKKDPF